ncbi:hypothetical protein BDF20DRAFT_898357 [Mycotypha africana]|uniref:uncharacterized protein n=1 Tax=Mycotypha africana TaxID=64632 RepID=UPI0023004B47|nr:uncharacterized protein BDF20DRAFT_898357 [Mycotypha africana]KAI8968010.1 hypothetical protein BDF20DRAFT_898357 [Mycotypha africana]
MVRSSGLQPNQVAFRVPPSCNKFDIHSYLTNIYGVNNIQEVRTMNYATVYKKRANKRFDKVQSAYKKAIVTLDAPFQYPPEPEWCKLDRQQFDAARKSSARKLNGWRIRLTEEERIEKKALDKAVQDRAEEEQNVKNKKNKSKK